MIAFLTRNKNNYESLGFEKSRKNLKGVKNIVAVIDCDKEDMLMSYRHESLLKDLKKVEKFFNVGKIY